MANNITISDSIKYIGVDDHDIDLFESQYVVPNGISYNSYLILDDKIAVMDTVDRRKGDEWLRNLETALDGRTPDYLVTLHMEADHASIIAEAMNRYFCCSSLRLTLLRLASRNQPLRTSVEGIQS